MPVTDGPYVVFGACTLLPIIAGVLNYKYCGQNRRRAAQEGAAAAAAAAASEPVCNGATSEARKKFLVRKYSSSEDQTQKFAATTLDELEAAPAASVGTAAAADDDDASANVCAICLGSWHEDDRLCELICRHVYHERCIDAWLKNHPTCAICKQDQNVLAGIGGKDNSLDKGAAFETDEASEARGADAV